MNKQVKDLVNKLRSFGLNLDDDGLAEPVGVHHLQRLLDNKRRYNARAERVHKPKPKARE